MIDRLKPIRHERGSAFILVTFLVITSAALVGAYLSSSLGKARHVENQAARMAAFHAAEAGLNLAVEDVWNIYRTATPATRVEAVADLDGAVNPDNHFTDSMQVLNFQVDTEVRSARQSGNDVVDVEIISRAFGATRDEASRTLRAVIRLELSQSRVFDHAYFINNFGWLWGSTIDVNGDVRSNGDFSLQNPSVNGDVLAAQNDELQALGRVDGTNRNDNLNGQYNNSGQKHRQARPSDPSAPPEDTNGNGVLDPGEDRNDNGVLDDFAYLGGYDGDSEHLAQQTPLEMPYLGDMQIYRDLATHNNGTISQGGQLLVQHVLGDIPSEPTSTVLIGTKQNPIVIDGPVVIEGDVLIRGVISGRGTIYAGRNVHIIGDIEYDNPPRWEKPLYDQLAAKVENATKDQVGLVAKGSVIMGDYLDSNWQYYVRQYARPPFTKTYVIDPTDAGNGYATGTNNAGEPTFNGDYIAMDGGLKDVPPPEVAGNGHDDDEEDGNDNIPTVPNPQPRRFYESSFPDDYFASVVQNDRVKNVDAVLYTNHLLSGVIGPTVFNGSLISRDEAIVYYGNIEMNHDVRIRGNGYEFMDIWLPREPTFRVLFWAEAEN